MVRGQAAGVSAGFGLGSRVHEDSLREESVHEDSPPLPEGVPPHHQEWAHSRWKRNVARVLSAVATWLARFAAVSRCQTC